MFSGIGIDEAHAGPDNATALAATTRLVDDLEGGLVFVNLVDNPRLDHNYTIIGEITTGMDAVDAILEGATIEKVELVSAR